MTRSQCLEWMASRGYQKPPRSACVFCPYHSPEEWHRLKTEEPEDFAKAVELERAIGVASDEVGQPKMFLHPSLKPLDEVVFLGPHRSRPPLPTDDRQEEMWSEECEGMCGV